jgi:glycosyltransferase involved in cell wall biosynthesis
MEKMKILWVCNVPIPRIAMDMNITAPNVCGWLTGFANSIEGYENIDLHIAFPQIGIKKMKTGTVGKIHYYAFSQPRLLGFLPVEDQVHVSKYMTEHLREIFSMVSPDILHIFGTEYPHSLVAAEVFNKPEKTIVNIQGLPSFYWMHFNNGIPYSELKRFTLSNIARGNLIQQAEKMKSRGMTEISTIKKVGHVIGRTDWDEACTKEINPNVQYHFCNESLRDSFYFGNWDYQKCEKHSIFMSQAATPIKGLHFMLQAMPEILREYPDAHLYVAGNDLTKTDTIYNKLKISSFAKYIKKLITKYGLENKVTFTGSLSEEEMKLRFLKSNVFVSPSTIENSPNSLGEAMILGIPCISSDVGGVKNLLKHEEEGYVYQTDAPYMLAYYVKKMFILGRDADKFGVKAQAHAKETHSREQNLKALLDIYQSVYKGR